MKKKALKCYECNLEAPDNEVWSTIDVKGSEVTLCEDCRDKYTTCIECEENHDTDTMIEVNSQQYCEGCYSDKYINCEKCGDHCEVNDAVTVSTARGDEALWCDSCAGNDAFKCDGCDNHFSNDDNYSVTTVDSQHTYCENCNDTYICDDCGARIESDNVCHSDDEDNEQVYCVSCVPESECGQIKNTFEESASFNINKSHTFIGFELEYVAKSFPSLPYSSIGQVHGDGSLTTTDKQKDLNCYEFSSSVRNGDALHTQIDEICKEIKNVGGEINASCGFHVHVDMRHTTEAQRLNVFRVFRAIEAVFLGMVSESRKKNRYAASVNGYSYTDCARDRYKTLNVAAFNEHSTFEFRLHQGTIDAIKIKNWIELLDNFVQTFELVDVSEENLRILETSTIREKLLFLFQSTKIPMRLKKYIVTRIKELTPTMASDLRVKQLAITLVPVETSEKYDITTQQYEAIRHETYIATMCREYLLTDNDPAS